MGGYISSVPRWLRFEKQWNRALKQADIDVFHMTDFMACADDFKDWQGRDDEQLELLLKLATITKKHVRRSFSSMVVLNDWTEVNKAYALKENHCTPYGLCAFYTMNKVMKWLLTRTSDFRIRFIFEDGDKNKGDFMWMMDQFYKLDKRVFAGARPSFEPKSLAPLQAADFVMWEQFHLAKDRIKNPVNPSAVRKSFRELLSIPHDWGVFDEEMLVKFCEGFGVPKRGVASMRPWSPFASLEQ